MASFPLEITVDGLLLYECIPSLRNGRTADLAGFAKEEMPAQISKEIFGSARYHATIWLIGQRAKKGEAWKTRPAA